jgi:hypothetical protein
MTEGAEDLYKNSKVVPLRGEIGDATPPNPVGLKGGGGGGTFDGMVPRIAALETHVEYIKRDIAELKASIEAVRKDVNGLKVDVATLIERVSHLPSKGFIVTSIISALAVIAGLITFQQQIQHVIGLK